MDRWIRYVNDIEMDMFIDGLQDIPVQLREDIETSHKPIVWTIGFT